ncbi:MAG: hypothetical protein Q4F98_06635 [Lachnospiraceae bacterium]|nr:hypothetical protein [Lachnospiraceae bacterium]
MLDRSKVKLMTKLALYEQTQGKEDFKVSEYYRKDYVGLHSICSFLWVTLGYICLWILILLASFDALVAHMSVVLMLVMATVAVVSYVVILIIYAGVTSHVYNQRHKDARQRVKMYNHDLIKLLRMYEKENK